MDRILLISADCHAGPLPETYREYLEKSVREDYAAWVGEAEEQRAHRQSLFEGKFLEKHKAGASAGGVTGAWDPEQRIRELEGERFDLDLSIQ